jgi:hypothetical protein
VLIKVYKNHFLRRRDMKKCLMVAMTILVILGFTYCGVKSDGTGDGGGDGGGLLNTNTTTTIDTSIPTPEVSSIDLNSATTAVEAEIILNTPTTYKIRLYGENFEPGAKVVLYATGSEKVFDNNKIIKYPAAADEIYVDSVPSSTFDELGTWYAYVKNDDTHKSGAVTFPIKSQSIPVVVDASSSMVHLTDNLPAGDYEIRVHHTTGCDGFGNCNNFAAQSTHTWNCGSTQFPRTCTDGLHFCFNVRFNGVNFYYDYATDIASAQEAYDMYKDKVLTFTIADHGSITSQFVDLYDSNYSNNFGDLSFDIQRVK